MKRLLSLLAATAALAFASSASAASSGTIDASLGGGFSSAGAVVGGFVLTPSIGYTLQLGDSAAVHLTNDGTITGLDYGAPGIIDTLTISGGYSSKSWSVHAGVGPAFVWTILCGKRYGRHWEESVFCNRAYGVAYSARFQVATYFDRSNLGAFLSGSWDYLPQGAVYGGSLFQVTAGPTFRLPLP